MQYFQPENREEWREWLKKNHCVEKGVWLVYYKKHLGKATISYEDSVEEAICFGWIDGVKRKLDEERYTHKFTARTGKSKWSPLNIMRAEKMIAAGRMTPHGLTLFEQRTEYEKDFIAARKTVELQLPEELEQVLKSNQTAWKNFVNLAPGYRKQYILWLTGAKRESTLQRRLTEAIERLAQNRKLGMK
ncbi:MAG: hypothetical protein GXO91_04885 [FCB group bacterium]|nr:hypothetical protein [FCB group bacterium]